MYICNSISSLFYALPGIPPFTSPPMLPSRQSRSSSLTPVSEVAPKLSEAEENIGSFSFKISPPNSGDSVKDSDSETKITVPDNEGESDIAYTKLEMLHGKFEHKLSDIEEVLSRNESEEESDGNKEESDENEDTEEEQVEEEDNFIQESVEVNEEKDVSKVEERRSVSTLLPLYDAEGLEKSQENAKKIFLQSSVNDSKYTFL